MAAAWDYIIIGAGSAGCVLAERLSADPHMRVLILEAGGANDSRWVSMPKGVAKLVSDPAHIWAYGVGEDKAETWIRGKGLGGSSAINGMIWSRGEPADYDAWEDLGCTGWTGAAMTEAFRALEDHGLGGNDRRGAGGPVHIEPKIFTYPLAEKMVEAGAQMGLKPVDDLNGVDGDRVGFYSHNIRRGKRESAANTYLSKAVKRPNVQLITGVVAERLIFAEGRVVAVELRRAEALERHEVAGEVIVSAGTLESPLLLQRSGIGPADILQAAGISPIKDAPIGRHMREHLGYSMPHRLNKNLGSQQHFHGLGLAKAMLRYWMTGGGIMATGPFEVGGFLNLTSADGRPDLQLYFGGYCFEVGDDKHPVPLNSIDKRAGLTIYGQLLRLKSEGEVLVTGPESSAAAQINPHWLSTTEDEQSAIAAVRAMRKFVAQPALSALVERELMPGAEMQTDTEILAAFRRTATSGLHGVGTCRMGREGEAAVDPQLRVRGVDGVRVVDCSVMPAPVTGNTNAPAMALALRAAEIISAARRA